MTHSLFTKDRTGFSLLEVMVATVILLVIVLMIGSIFRQGTSSWDSGYARAEGGMIVRGVVGSIQRELSTAVDGRRFCDIDPITGELLPSDAWKRLDAPVDVSDHEVSFICLKESLPKPGEALGATFDREPWYVTYIWADKKMTRNAYPLIFSESTEKWEKGAKKDSVIYSEYSAADQEAQKTTYSAGFTFHAAGLGTPPTGLRDPDKERPYFAQDCFWNIPYVSINIELLRTSSFSGLEVRSWGPDGKPGTLENPGDDIVVQ